MKRALVLLLVFVLLTGCNDNNHDLNRALSLRRQLLEGNGCSFDAIITADYGDTVYTFTMACEASREGDLKFTVTDPQTIAGITGTVTKQGGHLTFDSQALAFEMLADGQVTPVSSPWIFIRTLQSGYISACGTDGDYLKVTMNDSYENDALNLDIWLNHQNLPIRGEILWKGRRVVSLEVRNFSCM